MSLAGAGAADQHDVALLSKEVAACATQLTSVFNEIAGSMPEFGGTGVGPLIPVASATVLGAAKVADEQRGCPARSAGRAGKYCRVVALKPKLSLTYFWSRSCG